MTYREQRTVPVDLASVGAYGVERWQEEFFWPVSDEAYLGMADAIRDAITHEAQQLPNTIRDSLLVACNVLMFEFEHLLHAIHVLDALAREGRTPLVGDRSHWYAWLLRGGDASLRTPLARRASASAISRSLIDHVAVRCKQLLRSASMNTQSAGHAWRWLCMSSPRALTIGAPNDVIAQYYSRVRYPLVIRYDSLPHDLPIPAVDVEIGEALTALAMRLVDHLDKISRSRGVDLTNAHRDELIRYTENELHSAGALLHAVARARVYQPFSHFLCRNIRNPAQRAIAMTMRQRGAHIVSFTHGGSIGLFDSPSFRFSEFLLSDTFVAYTKSSADLFAWIAVQCPGPIANPVTFEASDDFRFVRLRERFSHTAPPTRVRRILYVGDSHAPWRRSLGNARFSLMHLDLERRLCALLIRHGYEVIYKAHPEQAQTVRPLLEDLVPVREEDFAQVLQESDAYLFGNIRTTAFPMALCTNKPVIGILLEEERVRVHPEAFAALQSRCAIVFAHFDERQRIIVPEAELLDALAHAPREQDMTFVETYMEP